MNAFDACLVRLLFVVPCLGIGGCLYEEPLAPGKAEAIDKQLLGDWRCSNAESKDTGILSISATDDEKYRAQFDPADDSSVFIAYAVRFEGQTLVNAQEFVGSRQWTLARYTRSSPDALLLELAKDEPFRDAKTWEERTQILKRELKKGDLFEDFEACVRAKP